MSRQGARSSKAPGLSLQRQGEIGSWSGDAVGYHHPLTVGMALGFEDDGALLGRLRWLVVGILRGRESRLAPGIAWMRSGVFDPLPHYPKAMRDGA